MEYVSPHHESPDLTLETTRLLEGIHDPEGVITDEFAATAVRLVNEAATVRHEQQVEPHDEVRWKIFLNEMRLAALEHSGITRRSGAPYFEHLVGTVENLITVLGRTRLSVLLGGFWHDSKEDLQKPLPSLVQVQKYGISELPKTLSHLQRDVAHIVEGCTKVPGATRDETTALTFRHFLSAMRKYGMDVAYVKMPDRLHNMSTLDFQPPDSQKRISLETENVYAQLATIFSVRDMREQLISYCLKYLQPGLIGAFNPMREERLKKGPYRYEKDIIGEFDPAVGAKPREDRRFLSRKIQRVRCVPYPISDFVVNAQKPFSNLELCDLQVSASGPMFETLVLYDPNKTDTREVMAYLVKRFGDPKDLKGDMGEPQQFGSAVERGSRLSLINRDFGGPMNFRINSGVDEALSKRGIMAKFPDRVPPDLKRVIEGILRDTKQDESQTLPRAREEFLRPTITVYTPDHQPIVLPEGATALDFAAELHSDFIIGAQSAMASYHQNKEDKFDTFEPIGLFDPLKEGMTVRLETCLNRGKKEYRRVKVDPGWLLFCKTEKARVAVRKYLSKYSPPGTNIVDAVVTRGQQYLEKLSLLFGVEEAELLLKLWELLPGVSGSVAIGNLGEGTIDLMKLISLDEFKDPSAWHISSLLPDEDGVLHEFTAEFKRQKINMRHVTPIQIKDDLVKLAFDAVDQTGDKSSFEMMKIFLKLSYTYDLAVDIDHPNVPPQPE